MVQKRWGVWLCGLLLASCPALAQADLVIFTVDSSQSTTAVTVAGSGPETSATDGTILLSLDSAIEPFGTAQVTQLELILQDSLSFSLAGGLVSLSTRPNDTTVALLTPGTGSEVTGGQFDQLQNLMGITGTADVLDPLGLLGGSGEFNLADIPPSLVDLTGIQLSRSGATYTLSANYSISQILTVNNTDIPILVQGNVVATGFAAVPEPTTGCVLLGAAGVLAMRRRRR